VAKLSWQRWAAIAGVAYVVLQIIMTVLFFVGGAPPLLADTAQWAAYALDATSRPEPAALRAMNAADR
jgi:hypothetical protein